MNNQNLEKWRVKLGERYIVETNNICNDICNDTHELKRLIVKISEELEKELEKQAKEMWGVIEETDNRIQTSFKVFKDCKDMI